MAKDRTDAIVGTYEQHPIALELMPGGMTETEFDAFCEDVQARGIIMPVSLYEGKVLDGWHRYRAGVRTGTPFKTIEYTGKDPAGYVASVNVLRRRLSTVQRALVGAKLHINHGLTQRDVCKKLGISPNVVTYALRALESKNAPLIKRLENDSDISANMLKEELTELGLLRSTPAPAPAPTGPNSVFNQAPPPPTLSDAARNVVPDTDGSDDAEDLLVGKGKAASDKKSKKAKDTAAQTLADGFKALMADEKSTFLRMIWPEASVLLELMPDLLPKKPAAKKPAAKK